ncbi:hypothetical protein [Legionella qingyii]|uniref:Uncharacterized protein n=1 Tax=Legionella qingyii TaxID=2184757 RepID=A0ABY0CK14_9GAMM|nr:hypothetical protein [Legionella qingyii]RUR23700.1 hypothetical protein ELY20_06740 [Legionella qingyii]RUR26283.1 hypothetical protein ELY16_07600 [Legionella qingyii]
MRDKLFYTLEEEQSITRIQSTIRGRLHRKKLGIYHARDVGMTYESTWLVGNDPKIEGLEPYVTPTGKIALVGTSGLRSLGLICELANQENIPKLIIVDNSLKVIRFWRLLRDLAERVAPPNFQVSFESFLQEHSSLFRTISEIIDPNIKYENQDPVSYMNSLIAQYGLDYVLSVIKNMVIIGQSWAESSLFIALNNILKLHGIEKTYTYPSNIEACVDATTRAQVATSIKLFKPCLSIASNNQGGMPTKVFLKIPETLEQSQLSQISFAAIQEIIDEEPYRDLIASSANLTVNIQELLKKLFSAIPGHDNKLSMISNIILRNMNAAFSNIKGIIHPDKQKQMVCLFLGGVIFAMACDNLKYGYRCNDEFKKYIVHLVSSVREEPVSNLHCILGDKLFFGEDPSFLQEVGNKVLSNLSGAFLWNLFTQTLNMGFGTPRAFLPKLDATNLALLLNFCEQHSDNLERVDFEVKPLGTELGCRI